MGRSGIGRRSGSQFIREADVVVVVLVIAGNVNDSSLTELSRRPLDAACADADVTGENDDVGVSLRRIEFVEFRVQVAENMRSHDDSLLPDIRRDSSPVADGRHARASGLCHVNPHLSNRCAQYADCRTEKQYQQRACGQNVRPSTIQQPRGGRRRNDGNALGIRQELFLYNAPMPEFFEQLKRRKYPQSQQIVALFPQ